MFTILLLGIYCFSLVISSSVDTKFNEKYIDGKQYKLKSVDTTYKQHVSNNGQCTVELKTQGDKYNSLTEGEIIKIKNKWFKVEECRLNRAYIASCGSKLFIQMRDLVCSYADQHYEKKVLKRRQIEDDLINVLDRSYFGLCCKNACTVSELIQYCPSK
ncbi:unnamed protein product [Adineta steineri]|uniref:Uncharacterized protein n=1 Tax=Adineta steineri TaxID=433720 RepID=A0A813RCM2_9BILA|nr:unnamed protein product [Adineta steineri]CAF3509112.1 unnamed protein product [Adineta steineri]